MLGPHSRSMSPVPRVKALCSASFPLVQQQLSHTSNSTGDFDHSPRYRRYSRLLGIWKLSVSRMTPKKTRTTLQARPIPEATFCKELSIGRALDKKTAASR